MRSTALLLFLLLAAPARADVPSAQTLATELGFSSADIASAQAGELVSGETRASNERELTATLLFFVPGKTPAQLIALAGESLLDRTDANTVRFGVVPEGSANADAFAKLALGPDQSKVWASAAPGSTLNVSSAEIASLDAASNDVEPIVRQVLAQRVADYRAKGLAGIAPYARDRGTRSPSDDLRSATKALTRLEKYAPHAYTALLDYPASRPAGTKEVYRWSQISAHDVPTIVLTHGLYMPDGDAWIVAQRQFYVSTGYNCEQALAAFLPTADGTMVFYENRTSTDQVTGFGGGMKRDLGSRILASSLKELFEKARVAAK